MPQLAVHLLPSLVEPEALTGSAVAVIDVLRATTTMIAALDAGAAKLTVCGKVDEARNLVAASTDRPLLGGERGGVVIPGFDLGNSPADYTPERVAGRRIIFTTTNGTRALLRCRLAERVLVAGFVNLSAVVAELANFQRVHIVCAGTEGHITREDSLLAGAITHHLLQQRTVSPDDAWQLNDEALLVLQMWRFLLLVHQPAGSDRPTSLSPAALAAELANSRGGQNVVQLQQGADIPFAATIDRSLRVPHYHPATNEVA